MFFVGQDERLVRLGLQDGAGQFQQFYCAFGGGLRGRAHGESKGLFGVGVETEEGLEGFDGAFVLLVFVPACLPLGVAFHMVGVDNEQMSRVMSAGPSYLSESALQVLSLGNGVRVEEFMNGLVGGDKRQPVGHLEAFLAQAAALAHARRTQGGLIDELQRQARFERFARSCRKALQQVPRAQAQVFGNQKPNAHQGSRNLVRKQLADTALDTGRAARFSAQFSFRALGLHALRVRLERVEFFFEGRILP